MQSLRLISFKQLRALSGIRIHSSISLINISHRQFFKFLQVDSKFSLEKGKAMEDKLKQIETNYQQILSRLSKLESCLSDHVKSYEQTRPSSDNSQLSTQLTEYLQIQKDLKNEVSSLSQEFAKVQLTVNSSSAELVNLKNNLQNTTLAPINSPPEIKKKKETQKKLNQESAQNQKNQPKPAKTAPTTNGGDDARPLDASRLDLRVGKIVDVQKHPDADSLYVEQIDCGEEKPRTVVSGLVKFVPIEQLQNRMVVILCNLKPAKMRGILSQAMVMCASTPDKVEVLTPPTGSVPGDRITFEKFAGQPDEQLNPKKKIWEQIAPDLLTNDDLVATYKGDPFIVSGKGPVLAETLSNVAVK